ncbi:hypothetical protein CC1G_12661 [Coprinopsis cinerea okayama7|uniref:T6SS Phospholipase effector Tle1-like catalytic domain-containing protein n=1 Tax=Coprinopsis cinerea (strain Okayama-7 / 130 / ATCC MYA-4618 / FGSC 9003) TaxID=240176 RepID=A8N1D7_COPC7|nr:hypothetical protein CC1G_12661 [Coprinopsis cinerea okayama7\|eukprot:XP_001828686.2 hypothetical protein CC1G_12661 [Coprinopsis cinerea okayama7\
MSASPSTSPQLDTLDLPLVPISSDSKSSLLFRTASRDSPGRPRSSSPPKSTSPHGTPNKSPRRINTNPDIATSDELRLRVNKRIILCCDGTWQDGIGEHRSMYTNVLRLARTIYHADERFQPPIPQIVFYQSGIGTEKNFYSEYIEGTTGGSLADKVEEAYAFIAHNYNPGDEIYLFGFSRGAYTARMVAMFVGEIGVLDRKEMDHFGKIFLCYQKLGKSKKAEEIKELQEQLHRWRNPQAPGKLRADCDGDTFTVKCLGVFDTVGSLGLPESLTLRSSRVRTIFGFRDRILGEHIERAYQALALHEMRADFNCNKFTQTEKGFAKGQVLKQCWFAGAHSDVGGGYKEHDLADIALTWMAAHVGDILAIDTEYLFHLPQPVAEWGKQVPHDSKSGIFLLAQRIQRELPRQLGGPHHEYIHPSVLEQESHYKALKHVLDKLPGIVCPLLPLEEELKQNWPYTSESPVAKTYTSELEEQLKGDTSTRTVIRRSGTLFRQSIFRSLSVTRKGRGKGEADIEVEVVEEEDQVEEKIEESRKLKKQRRRTVYAISRSEG